MSFPDIDFQVPRCNAQDAKIFLDAYAPVTVQGGFLPNDDIDAVSRCPSA